MKVFLEILLSHPLQDLHLKELNDSEPPRVRALPLDRVRIRDDESSLLKAQTFTFVSASLGELDVLGVRGKDPDAPPAAPLHRRGFIGCLGQTRDLGGRPRRVGGHDARLYTCNTSELSSAQLLCGGF